MGSSTSDSSLLLWTLGALLSVATAYAALGWVRHARYLSGRHLWGGVAAGAALLGVGFTVATVLAVAGEALAFPIGFRRDWAIGLTLLAMLLSLPVLAIPAHRRGMPYAVATAALLALLGALMQVGWILAVGFRPGISWRIELIAIGVLAMTVGFSIALMLTFPDTDRKQRSEAWKLVAATLMGLAWLGGEALVLAAANLQVQVGSIYRHELSGSLTALIGAGVLPIVLAFVIVDLELRRRHRRMRLRAARRAGQRWIDPATTMPAPEDTLTPAAMPRA